MNAHELLSSPLVCRLGWTLLHSVWEVAAVAALLWIVLALLRRASPPVRYLAAGAAMAAMLTVTVATFLAVGPFAPQTPQPAPAPASAEVAPGLMPVLEPPTVAHAPAVMPVPVETSVDTSVEVRAPLAPPTPAENPPAVAGVQPWPERCRHALAPYLPWSVGAWLAGVMVLSLWRAGGWLAAYRLRVVGAQPVGQETLALLQDLARRLGLRRPVRIVHSLIVQTPMVIGWLRPVILLPLAAVAGLTPDQLEAILAHELAHVRRLDYLVNLLQAAMETLFFYHPATWWVSRRMRAERERCCDDVAVAICGNRIGYVEALAAVEEVRPAAPYPALARRRGPAVAAAGTGGEDLIDRVRRVLGLPAPAGSAAARSAVAILIVVAMLGISIGLHVSARGGDPAQPATSTAPAPAPAEKAAPLADLKHIRGFALQPRGGDKMYREQESPATTRPTVAPPVPGGDEKDPYEQFIGEIAETGANAVCLVLTAFQDNAGSTAVAVKPDRMPSDKRLKELIAAARRKGLRVVLHPIVLLDAPRPGEWRGKIEPDGQAAGDAWWKSYADYILHYAALAEQAKADVFIVGSELVALEDQTQRWADLIARARKQFGGLLTYSANWDHYEPVQFWDKLDLIGITSYYDISNGKDKPTLDDMLNACKSFKKDVLSWQGKVNKPILFTEVGFPSQETAAKEPWNYYGSTHTDPALQKRCFEAFFKTWADEPAVAGWLIWEWRNRLDQDTDPKNDTGYCPKDKPAMEVIKQYFRLPQPATQPERGKSESTSAQATELKVSDVTFSPLVQGRNNVRATVENLSDAKQVFGIHIYTRSPQFGPDGVGWGMPFFATLGPGEKKNLEFAFKIHGPITDDTYVRLSLYNPPSERGYDYDRFFDRQTYLAKDIKAQQQQAQANEGQAVLQAFREMQQLLAQEKYPEAWDRLSKKYKEVEFQSRAFKAFEAAMKGDLTGKFIWSRQEFLQLKPLSVSPEGGTYRLKGGRDGQVWTLDFIREQDRWMIDWVGGYTPGIIQSATQPATAPAAKAGERAEGEWGQPAGGLAMRLAAPQGMTYKTGKSLPLKLQIKNVSEQAVSLEQHGWYADIEATDASGSRLVVRPPTSLGPWKVRKEPLAGGEVIEWQELAESIRFWRPPRVPQDITIRFRLPGRGPAAPGQTGPLIQVFSNPIKLTFQDLPTNNLKEQDVPEKWAGTMSFAYLEDMGLAGWRLLQVDPDGTARLVRPAGGSPDTVVPWGTYRVRLTAQQLARLAGLLRAHRVWDLPPAGEDLLQPLAQDEGDISLRLTCGDATLVRLMIPDRAVRQHKALQEFRDAMRAFMGEVASAASQPATTQASAEHIAQLISKLGNQVHKEREQAQEELVRIGLPAVPALTRAAANADPEIATRADQTWAAICPIRVKLLHERDEYLLGENIVVRFRLENHSAAPAPYERGGFYPDSRVNDGYRITATRLDESGKPLGGQVEGRPWPGYEGGKTSSWRLDPGQSFEQTLYVGRYLRFVEPGRYRLRITNVERMNPKKELAVGETKITLKLPTPAQARQVYERMKKLPGGPVAGIGERQGVEIPDFEGMLHPVYLPILAEYAGKGDRDALTALGQVQTPDSVKALVGLVEQALRDNNLDLGVLAYQRMGSSLPNPRFYDEKYGDPYSAQRQYVGRTWRQEYALPLRQLAARLARAKESKALDDISFIYESAGTPGDLPDLTLAYSKSIEATKTLPFETHQYFRPRGSAYSYRFSTRQLLARGAEVPPNPATAGEAAVYFIALHDRQDSRPKDWTDQAVRWLAHPTPYMRELVLEFLPKPVPAGVLDLLPKLLADEYVDLQIAACHTARQEPREAFREPIQNILRRGTETYLLNAAAEAAGPNGIAPDQVMEIWTGRIDGDLSGSAVARLLGVIDVGDGGGSAKQRLSAEEASAAKVAWTRFIQAHRGAIRAGQRFSPGEPAITPDLFPPGFDFWINGKPWAGGPVASAPASAPSQPAATQPAVRDASPQATQPGLRAAPPIVVQSQLLRLNEADERPVRVWLASKTGQEIAQDKMVSCVLDAKTADELLRRVKAIASTTVMSRPQLMAADGQTCSITVGSRVPVRLPVKGKQGVETLCYLDEGSSVRLDVQRSGEGKGIEIWGRIDLREPDMATWAKAPLEKQAIWHFGAVVPDEQVLLARIPLKYGRLFRILSVSEKVRPEAVAAPGDLDGELTLDPQAPIEGFIYALFQPAPAASLEKGSVPATQPATAPATQPATLPAPTSLPASGRLEERGAERESAADRAARKRLAQVIPKVEFSGIGLADVVQFMRDISGQNIYVDWQALKAVGVQQKTPVHVKMRDVSIQNALRTVLDDVGQGQLGLELNEGIITLTSKAVLATHTVVRVYDVRDLVEVFPPAEPAEIGWLGQRPTPAPATQPVTKDQLTRNVLKLIQETVDPKSWLPESKCGSIREIAGQLIITQTKENHRAVLGLVSQLREAGVLGAALEERFLEVGAKTDQLLTKWLADKHKAGFEKDIFGRLLSEDDVKALVDEAKKYTDQRLLTPPKLTLYNGRTAWIYVLTNKTVDLPLLGEPGKTDKVGLAEGTILTVTAYVAADRKYVTVTETAETASLKTAWVMERAKLAKTVSMPDGLTVIFRVPVERFKVLGVRPAKDAATGKTIQKVVEEALPGPPERYLYLIIQPKVILQREDDESGFPEAAPVHLPAATQPATQPAGLPGSNVSDLKPWRGSLFVLAEAAEDPHPESLQGERMVVCGQTFKVVEQLVKNDRVGEAVRITYIYARGTEGPLGKGRRVLWAGQGVWGPGQVYWGLKAAEDTPQARKALADMVAAANTSRTRQGAAEAVLLPGSGLWAGRAIAPGEVSGYKPFAIALVTATDEGQEADTESGLVGVQQEFQVREVIAGELAQRSVKISFYRGGSQLLTLPERAIRKGESLIWILRPPVKGDVRWLGAKALLDTPINRQVLLAAAAETQPATASQPATQAATRPATQAEAFDLDVAAGLLAEKVGGKWESGFHSALRQPNRILRGRVPGPGDSVQLFDVFPFPAGDHRRMMILRAYEKSNVRIIGWDERLVLVKASPLEVQTDAAVAAVLGVRPVVLTPGDLLNRSAPPATRPPTQPATQPAAKRAPAEIAQELLARISDATDGKLDEQGLQALAVLRDSDLDFAKLLKDEYFTRPSGKAVDVVRNSVILKALECLGTSPAKQSLLDIACTEQPNAQTLGPRAVQALAKITKDSDEIALALRAPHSATRDAAAQAMAHRSLSAAAVDALATQMTSSSWITQNLVGTAFATDTSPTSAARKIAAILENYPKLGSRVDDKQSVPGGVFWTPTEMARSSYISALSAMEGGEKELRRRMADVSKEQREPLLLALGRRGVGEVRPELLKMARSAEEDFVRANAVASLYYIATEEDMAILRDLAESDPFERTITGGRDGERKAYPVRDAARQVLQRVEKDKKAPSASSGPATRPPTQPATQPAGRGVLTLPAEWDRETLAKHIKIRVQALAKERLEGHEWKDLGPDGLQVLWKTRQYEVRRPADKGGRSWQVRTETGPVEDGLMLGVSIVEEPGGQLARPQTLDNDGLWKSFYGERRLPQFKAYLYYNVAYGPKTDPQLVDLFSWPEKWLEGLLPSSSTQPATQPAGSLGPVGVAQAFLEALNAGQDEKAKALTLPGTVKTDEFPKFREFYDLSSVRVEKALANSGEACIVTSALLPRKNGQAMTMGIGLTRNGDRWLVRDVDALPTEDSISKFVESFKKANPDAATQPATGPVSDGASAKGATETAAMEASVGGNPRAQVEVILGKVAHVDGMAGRDEPLITLPWTFPCVYTKGEAEYEQQLKALRAIQGADAILRELTDKQTRVALSLVILARAHGGDILVAEQIRRILKDDKAGMVRAWAAEALGLIGSDDDLPLLEKVAKDDPLSRERGGDVGPPAFTKAMVFPVRMAATDAAKVLAAWGPAGQRVQSRLRPLYSGWDSQPPELWLDVSNRGQEPIIFDPIMQSACELEVDGKWYGWSKTFGVGMPVVELKPGGKIISGIRITFDRDWAQPAEGKELRFAPGVEGAWGEHLAVGALGHTVRVRFRPTKPNVQVVSNAVKLWLNAAASRVATQPAQRKGG